MTEPSRGPRGSRRGRGARERILEAARHLFREQGINATGMDQLCAEAKVSKRTAYQHFAGKDDLVAAYLHSLEADVMPDAAQDLDPRERLLAAFTASPKSAGDPTPLCPFVGAAVEIADPTHPARVRARNYKTAVAARLADVAREAGATEPDRLGEQLALLLDGASARTRALHAETMPVAATVADLLIDQALPGRPLPSRPGSTERSPDQR